MSFDFSFRTLDCEKNLKRLIDFISKQDLGYKSYQDWVQKTEYELDSGYKQAILAFSEKRLIGDLIYQPHKGLSGFLELKNLRIHPEIRRRDFGHFMLKQMEAENKGYAIICDLRPSEQEAMNLLLFSGYFPIASVNLYDPNREDIVMVKIFGNKEGLIHRAKNLILS